MKKLLIAAFAVFAFAQVNAQEFKGGINVGLPIGDFSDAYSFNVTADLSYLWDVADSFKAGVATGLNYNFGDTINGFDIDDAAYIPVAGAARYSFTDAFALGIDLGYGLGITPSGFDGGFYFSPRLEYGITDSLDIVAAYRSVSDNGSLDAITLGIQFGF